MKIKLTDGKINTFNYNYSRTISSMRMEFIVFELEPHGFSLKLNGDVSDSNLYIIFMLANMKMEVLEYLFIDTFQFPHAARGKQ